MTVLVHIKIQDGRERDEEMDLPIDPAILARYLSEEGDSLIATVGTAFNVLILREKAPLLDRNNIYIWNWARLEMPDPNLSRLYSRWMNEDVDFLQPAGERWLLEF